MQDAYPAAFLEVDVSFSLAHDNATNRTSEKTGIRFLIVRSLRRLILPGTRPHNPAADRRRDDTMPYVTNDSALHPQRIRPTPISVDISPRKWFNPALVGAKPA
jgi:hypothetical protein